MVEQESKTKDQQKLIALPLFPGYLFVQAEMNATIYLKVLRIKGVVGFFCNGGIPAIIPDEQVEGIQRSLKNGQEVTPCNSLESIRPYMTGNRAF